MTAQQHELMSLMEDISEECHSAGWHIGLEQAIWGALQDGNPRYGSGSMNPATLTQIQCLSEDLDGWVVFVDNDFHDIPNDLCGRYFIPMNEWREMYQQGVVF